MTFDEPHDDDQIFIRRGLRDDLPGCLGVQYDAFGRVARELSIPTEQLPPLNESLDDLLRLGDDGTVFFVADCDSTIIGCVRADESDGRVLIGRLVVAAGWTRRGVATALMDHLEASFPDADRFVLFTGVDASAPLALYEGRGYRRERTEVTSATTLVWLEKPAHED